MKIDRICLNCNKVFKVKPSRTQNGKAIFCTNSCKMIFRYKNHHVTKTCKHCQKEFNTTTKKDAPIFCSKKCGNLGKRPPTITEEIRKRWSEQRTGEKNPNFGKRHSEKIRKFLSDINKGKKHTEEHKKKISNATKGEKNPFYGKKHSASTKEKISKIHKGKPLSLETRQKLSQALSGAKHPNWRGGITYEAYDERFNNKFKKVIKMRENNHCFECNTNKKVLNIHHIDYDKKNTVAINCVALCDSCHGKTNGNRKYWAKYLYQKLLIKLVEEKKKIINGIRTNNNILG